MALNNKLIKKANHGKRPCRGNVRRKVKRIRTPR